MLEACPWSSMIAGESADRPSSPGQMPVHYAPGRRRFASIH